MTSFSFCVYYMKQLYSCWLRIATLVNPACQSLNVCFIKSETALFVTGSSLIFSVKGTTKWSGGVGQVRRRLSVNPKSKPSCSDSAGQGRHGRAGLQLYLRAECTGPLPPCGLQPLQLVHQISSQGRVHFITQSNRNGQ